MEAEYRYFEVRREHGRRISGTVVRYGDRANISGVFTEEVAPGGLRSAGEVILNKQHDRSFPLVREGSGLEFFYHEDALRFRADLPETDYGNRALELVRHNLLRGASVEMKVSKDSWDRSADHRIIYEARMVGLALVDKSAYPDSSIAIREKVVKLNMVGPFVLHHHWIV